MAFQLTQYDRELVDNTVLMVSNLDGSLERIKLQFPPKVANDNKSAVYEFTEAGTYEPIAVLKGANSRKISLNLTYVVTGGEFTANVVATELRKIKRHLYRGVLPQGEGEASSLEVIPAVRLEIYQIVPGGDTTQSAAFRLTEVQVDYSETLISSSGSIYDTFPLISTVSLSLELMTQIGSITGEQQAEFKIDAPNLPEHPIFGWY